MKKQNFIQLIATWGVFGVMFGLMLVLLFSKPNNELTEGQVLELAHQRALEFGLTQDVVIEKPSLGKDGRLEYSTTCSFYGGFNPNHASVIVCKEWTTIYYDDGRGAIVLNPHNLKLVPQFLQSMPPGSALYLTLIEETAKIDQVIFWVDQGRLYPEAASK